MSKGGEILPLQSNIVTFVVPRSNGENFPAFLHSELEILESGACAAADNMRMDEARAHACAAGEAPPLLRLYAWRPWAVSLGANQRESDIDARRCAERGFAIVRRPTGGRAVLHANELTYCVVAPLRVGYTATDLYRDVHVLLLGALQELGARDMSFQKSQPDFRSLYKTPARSLPCFASAARYELQWRGKKIVGSAQRRFGNVVLQHGSLLLGAGHEQLADVATLADDTERAAMKKSLREHTATLQDICGRIVTYSECAEVIEQHTRNALRQPYSLLLL